MRRVLLLALLASALVSSPAARLAAAISCGDGGAMDCCAGMGHDDAPPCHCSLKPVLPAPAAIDAAHAPAVVLVEAPLPAVVVEVPATARRSVRIAPHARSAPLHLLFSTLLV